MRLRVGSAPAFCLIVCAMEAAFCCRAAPKPLASNGLVADFRFIGGITNAITGSDSKVDLRNAPVTGRGLELVRGYEYEGSNGYRATFDVPEIRQSEVGFAVDFMPYDFRDGRGNSLAARLVRRIRSALGLPIFSGGPNIITGGNGFRWIGFNHGSGHLQLTLNNQAFVRDFTNVVVTTGEWHSLACSLDLEAREVRVALDGKLLPITRLADDFELEVLITSPTGGDRNFTFANYSNGQAFHGIVARLQIYGRALSSNDLLTLNRQNFDSLPNPRPPIDWVIAITFVALVSAVLLVRRSRRKAPNIATAT